MRVKFAIFARELSIRLADRKKNQGYEKRIATSNIFSNGIFRNELGERQCQDIFAQRL